MISAKIANKIWIASQLRDSHSFHENCFHLQAAQSQKLKNYINSNSATQFGKQFKFHSINSYSDFQKLVPIHEWEDIEPWVSLIKKGDQNILTKQHVELFEETSGTSSFSKLIPYTATLKKEIQQGVGAWMVALFKNNRAAFEGSAYWSISPPLKKKENTIGGIPIGIEDDKDYFNHVTKFLLNKIIAVPSEIKSETNVDLFYSQTFEHLLLKEDLSFISVWSPTFFLQMDNFMKHHKTELLEILIKKKGNKNKRIQFLKERLSSDFSWKDIWPQLNVLSCWTDAQSALWIDNVKEVAGAVYIQGKGLLSTEGISSIPILKDRSPVLSVNSHFYEFRDTDSNEIFLAQQLKKNAVYEIILTTGGGLYRYASADLIEVDGFHGDAPSFKFLGRKNNQSDLVGEKLSEVHVVKAVLAAFDSLLSKIELAFVYPVMSNQNKLHYGLYIESKEGQQPEISNNLLRVTAKVESILMENPYYKTALDLKQLSSMEGHLLEPGFKEKYKDYLHTHFNIKDGNIKIPVLFKKESLKTILAV